MEHIDSLRTHLRGRLGDEYDVQDLAQEACVRLLHASNTREIDNPRAYLYQIANRLLWQHYTARANSIDTGVDPDHLAAPHAPLDETVTQHLRQERVEQAMQALSLKCQAAIVLRWHQELPIAEIAERMNLSRGMVKKYLANGLAHFKRRLHRFAAADARP